ncbi:cell division protein FtsZ [Patescibacteria group bacterium]|nr:cell division protein FtsZ [Patescibacteria group bacterium]
MAKTKSIEIKPDIETFAKIKVVGVGGGGGSAINRMIKSKIKGVEFIAVNTDAQALSSNESASRIHIGRETTRGLGAGMDPELGAQSAEENEEDLKAVLDEADMVFITCGLGGGTGTGAAPIIADIAKELGALTVAVVTKPFAFEGAQRKNIAERGLDNLIDKVDTIITIPNDRLLQVIDKKTSLLDAFAIVDEVLKQGVQGISDVITVPGLINVDFADIKAIMKDAGSALMGIGRASGEDRAVVAARNAIDSPLLELSIKGAKGVLFTVSGGQDLSMHEVNEAAEVITSSIDSNAKVIFGAVIDEALGDEVKITVIATGFNTQRSEREPESSSTREQSMEEKSGYASSPFVKIEDKQKAMTKSLFSKRSAKAAEDNRVELPPKTKEEEELEIPAFIRKKMGDK